MGTQPTTRKDGLVRKILIDLGVMTVAGTLLALVGPFGSYQDPLAIRLVVWIGLAWVGYAVYAPIGPMVDRFHRRLDIPKLGLWVAGTLLATIPMAAIVWALGASARGSFELPDAQSALVHYANVLVIGAALTVLFLILERRTPADMERQTDSAAPTENAAEKEKSGDIAFLNRLPAELGTELIALEMEDHYVRAHTALGSDLVLMRMRDAIAELDGIEGMQVHRSWWVARGAVEDVRREGRNVRLVLPGDLEAPVSRANVQTLKDAGWI